MNNPADFLREIAAWLESNPFQIDASRQSSDCLNAASEVDALIALLSEAPEHAYGNDSESWLVRVEAALDQYGISTHP